MDAVSIAIFTTTLAASQTTKGIGSLTDGEAATFAILVSVLIAAVVYDFWKN